jgi:hypothetical protein
LLDALGKLIAGGTASEEDRQARAMLEVSEGFRAAVDRLKSRDYERYYKGKGDNDTPNLYIEGFFDGMEAGMKAAGIVVKTLEDNDDKRKTPSNGNC